MSLSARIKKPESSPEAHKESENIQLTSFSNLIATLHTRDEYKEYKINLPEEGIASLTKGEVNITFLDKDLWIKNDRSNMLMSLLKNQKAFLLLTGDEEDFQSIENTDIATHHQIQQLCFPIDLVQLKYQVENLIQDQSMLIKSLHSNMHIQSTNESIKYIMRISKELNNERDINKLLSLILKKARDICHADAGSIYVVKWKDDTSTEGTIHFKVTQNESVVQNLAEFQIPANDKSVVGNSVIHKTSINIPDLYKLSSDRNQNPYRAHHDKTWDKRIGYECRSMLTLPLFDISDRVIGVIQLINRKKEGVKSLKNASDFNSKVVPFDEQTVEFVKNVAHQAGIALENALLTEEREKLFEGFVQASVTAIEQRDPTASGHSNRVAKLTLGLAKKLNEIKVGPFSDLHFNSDQLKELEFSALLHDYGKLGVGEQILTKKKKLHPYEEETIKERFEHVLNRHEAEYLEQIKEYLEQTNNFPPGFSKDSFLEVKNSKIELLEDFFSFIIESNNSAAIEQRGFEKLKQIASTTYKDLKGEEHTLLSNKELNALSISRGSLTEEENTEFESHVTHTYEFLRKIPWGRKFANVPQIAFKHHEYLDGTGYPSQCYANEIPIQSRIMAIADSFDTLTTIDKPYRKRLSTNEALNQLKVEAETDKLDPHLFEIFKEFEIYKLVKDT